VAGPAGARRPHGTAAARGVGGLGRRARGRRAEGSPR
jgi:hypothetical protein